MRKKDQIDEATYAAKWKHLRELDGQIRGGYLVEANTLEWKVSLALVSHFFPDAKKAGDRRLELLLFVLGNPGYTFRSKVSALRHIVKQSYPELWPKYSPAINLLDKIVAYRNMIAHSQMGASLELLGDESGNRIELTEYKNGVTKIHTVTKEESVRKLAEVEKAFGLVEALESDMVKRARASKVDRRMSTRFVHQLAYLRTNSENGKSA